MLAICSRLHFKRALCRAKKKENKGSQKKKVPEKREKGFFLAKLDLA